MAVAGALHKEDSTMEEEELWIDVMDWEACQVDEVQTSEERTKEALESGWKYLRRKKEAFPLNDNATHEDYRERPYLELGHYHRWQGRVGHAHFQLSH